MAPFPCFAWYDGIFQFNSRNRMCNRHCSIDIIIVEYAGCDRLFNIPIAWNSVAKYMASAAPPRNAGGEERCRMQQMQAKNQRHWARCKWNRSNICEHGRYLRSMFSHCRWSGDIIRQAPYGRMNMNERTKKAKIVAINRKYLLLMLIICEGKCTKNTNKSSCWLIALCSLWLPG